MRSVTITGHAFAVWGIATLLAGTVSAAPQIQTFTASFSGVNQIKLDWRVTGSVPSGQVYIYGPRSYPPHSQLTRYDDVGSRPVSCPAQQPVGCSDTFRVREPGVYRYVLSATNSGGTATSTVEVTVPDTLTPPTVNTMPVPVGIRSEIQPQVLSWSHAAGPGYVTLSTGFFPTGPYPTTGTLQLPAESFVLHENGMGENGYALSYCEEPVPGDEPFCSRNAVATYVVEPAQFSGEHREFVAPNTPVTLTWSGPGTAWFLAVPSAGFGEWVTEPQYTFAAGQLPEGVNEVSLTTCRFSSLDVYCSNRFNLVAPTDGTITFESFVPAGDPVFVQEEMQLATLTPDGGGPPITFTAQGTGTLWPFVANGAHVAAGEEAGALMTNDNGYHEIVVGSAPSVPTWQYVPWNQTFTAQTFDTAARSSTGAPLDVTFDASGDLWGIGEFSSAVARAQGGSLTHYEAPYQRVLNSQTGVLERTTPFVNPFKDGLGRTYVSGAGERVMAAGDTVWFTHGGSLVSRDTANYSRIIGFRKNATDSPSTPDDDRLCAIHVPTDGAAIIGATWDGQRIWVAESRSGSMPTWGPPDWNFPQSALSWFVPSEFTGACDNYLDYSSPSAVAAASQANHCTTPSQTRCFHEVLLPPEAGRASQVVWDPAGYVWFTDQSGGSLGRYQVSNGQLDLYPMPTAHSNMWVYAPFFRSFPWQLRVDANAVYIGEYADVDLVRFDKNAPNPAACETLVAGNNPCMKELYLPRAIKDGYLHSIALQGNHLWFTLSNEFQGPDPTASAFGYVDVDAWATGTPTGVIYTNLESLGTADPVEHHAFRGIEVSSTGKVGLADMRKADLVQLTPLP